MTNIKNWARLYHAKRTKLSCFPEVDAAAVYVDVRVRVSEYMPNVTEENLSEVGEILVLTLEWYESRLPEEILSESAFAVLPYPLSAQIPHQRHLMREGLPGNCPHTHR